MTHNARALLDEFDRATAPVVQTIYDLRAIREQWGDLLAAIEHPPAREWPPRERRGFLDQAAADDDLDPAARVGRPPLILRAHPAPINLDALDAAIAVERDLFDLADQIAEQVQRPVRTGRDQTGRFVRDEADAANPARWHPPTHRDAGPAAVSSAGSRAYGLHWAAVWIEGRVAGEDLDGDLFQPMPPRLLDHTASVAARARRTVETALDRDRRTISLDDPCPWCHAGTVTVHRPSDDPREAYATCATGPDCPAPVLLERGRRTWRGPDLTGLWTALDAARRRGE